LPCRLESIAISFALALGACAGLPAAHAKTQRADWFVPLPTYLAAEELRRERLDGTVYPAFTEFLELLDIPSFATRTDSRNSAWIPSRHFLKPTRRLWKEFFQAAAADRLTAIRALALLGRELKSSGAVLMGGGTDYERAVEETGAELGLALPAKNIGAIFIVPDPAVQAPGFLAHLKVFYTQSYVHRFQDEILPADLKIAESEKAAYWIDGTERLEPSITADLFYGEETGVGFRNVKGIAGKRHGFMGFLQSILFFIPDSVGSMVIDERSGKLVTEAFMGTEVPDFEKDPRYAITVSQASARP